ncbi:MAG: hypothetical protein ACTSU4_11750 [Promethearchaeota archaeon]
MKKKSKYCLICGAKIQYIAENSLYKCQACEAIISPEIFKNPRNTQEKKKWTFPWLKLLFAALGALYLFYLIMRIFIY